MTTLAELRAIAKGLPNVTEGFSCKGTVLESRTVKVFSRAFLFLGNKGEVRLKLHGKLGAARKLAAKHPDVYTVGAGGWMKIMIGDDPPPLDLLEEWIEESYALIAGRDAAPKARSGAAKRSKKRTVKKSSRRQR